MHIRTAAEAEAVRNSRTKFRLPKWDVRAQEARVTKKAGQQVEHQRKEVQLIQFFEREPRRQEGWVNEFGCGRHHHRHGMSCWPVGQGAAFPTMWFHRKMVLKRANGGDVGHYCQKKIFLHVERRPRQKAHSFDIPSD